MRRVALLLEYDGTEFAGSQLQPVDRTVQGVLEKAAASVTDTPGVRVAFAGRTDAGVHAEGQVASFVTESALDTQTLRRALNACLPPDVSVKAVAEVSEDFDPRRWAVRRRYRYEIDYGPVRSALTRTRTWYVAPELDCGAMTDAARRVIGMHDFAPFASRLEDDGASTVRQLYRFDVEAHANRYLCTLEANAFLPHQVRRMVGAVVEVGKHRMTPKAFEDLLRAPACSAGPTAPPHGLYLEWVFYSEDPFRGLDSPQGVC